MGIHTLKRMAECAWQTTCVYIEDCNTTEDVALTFSVALRAIAEYQTLRDEERVVDNHQEIELLNLDDCPGYQFLIGKGEK